MFLEKQMPSTKVLSLGDHLRSNRADLAKESAGRENVLKWNKPHEA